MRISVAAVAVASVVSLVSFASVAAAQGAPPAAGAPAPPPPGYNAPPGGGPPPGYPPPGYPPPGYAYPPPAYAYPPAAPPDASVHNHDGFYLQMALGFAYVSDSNTPPTGGDVKLTGGGGTGQLMIGGTVGRGVVLGGGLQASVFSNPKVKLADGSTATGNGASLNVTAVGPFVDYYFDPHEGLHLQALVGLGTLSVTNGNGTSDSSINPKGLALSVGFGDEWWVAEQWSIGILARLQYVSAKASNDVPTGLGTSVTYEDKHSVVIPALLATFTLH